MQLRSVFEIYEKISTVFNAFINLMQLINTYNYAVIYQAPPTTMTQYHLLNNLYKLSSCFLQFLL